MNKIYGEIDYPVLKEKLFYKKFDNGFEAYVIPKPGFSKVFGCIGTHFGSVHNKYQANGAEHDIPDGVAHFLEHKLFEQEDVNVFQKFAEYGANPNAYTSFNKTVYLFSCTDNYKECLDLLLNYVKKPYFTPENVEKEKGIIEQEIGMISDSSDRALFFNFLKALYKENSVRVEIAGSKESISGITDKLLYDCYNAFYHPSNMVMVVVGDVDVDYTFEKASETWGSIDVSEESLAKKIFKDEPTAVNKRENIEQMDIPTAKFLMGYKDSLQAYSGPDAAKKQMAMEIIMHVLFGKSSPLFEKLYEQGLINSTFSCEYVIEEDYAYSAFGGESNDIDQAVDVIITEINGLKNAGLDKDAFERVKRAKRGEFIKALDDVESIANDFIYMFMKGFFTFDCFDLYDKIDYDYANEVFRNHFKDEQISISKVVPKNGGKLSE